LLRHLDVEEDENEGSDQRRKESPWSDVQTGKTAWSEETSQHTFILSERGHFKNNGGVAPFYPGNHIREKKLGESGWGSYFSALVLIIRGARYKRGKMRRLKKDERLQ